MKQFFVLIALLIVLALFLSGCTQTTICGDGLCSQGEENTCPTDCAEPVNATVNINVSGGWDATGDLSLYWYHSKDVYANASANITSRLGENWFGEQSKNLYISFNDSKSGSVPVGDNRNISMNFSEPGDYYFEVRSEDYEYRAVSDKITITESKDYYVDLSLTPSNPALRVKAYDEYGNQMNGDGKITLIAVEENCKYGECNQNEWEYDSRYFYGEDEMNALFFVYIPQKDYYTNEIRDIHYKIKVEKEGYLTQTQYYWPSSKYSEYSVLMQKEVSNEKGDLSIKIIPGVGTVQEDIAELYGETVTVCQHNGFECYDSIINGNVIEFYDLPYDTYSFAYNGSYNYQSSHPPMSLESGDYVVDGLNRGQYVKALRGIGIKMSAVNASGILVPAEEVFAIEQCYSNDGGVTESCMVMDPPSPMPQNPIESSMRVYSENDLDQLGLSYWKAKLKYQDQEKWFTVRYKQGYNEIVFLFDDYYSGIDHNYVEDVELGNSIYVDGGIDYNGQILKIQFIDVIQTTPNTQYEGKFGLYSNGVLIQVVQSAPVFDLKDEFGDSMISTSAVVEAVGLRLADNTYTATIRVE